VTLAAGDRLGPYEILSPLGAGGMGEVYRARDTRLGREVALKVLPEEISSDSERLRRFEQEAQAASALNHPNIVVVHDVGRDGAVSYLAMELVSGTTLRDLLLPSPLPTRKVLSLAAQVADGLANAHAAGIVHRDLKPENVMVSDDGFVKILDFGLAKRASLPGTGVTSVPTAGFPGTEAGTVLGTVGYMSPEQAAGRELDYRSDQFSFGSILYEMATGRRAFRGDSAAQTMAAIIEGEPSPVASLKPDVPAPLCWVIERCLAKAPGERYESTRDLARDLSNLRDRAATASASLSGEGRPAAPSRRRLFAAVAFIGLLLTAAAGAFLLGRRSGGRPPPSFTRLTFRRGTVSAARFAPDGKTILYSASWEGGPSRVFLKRPESVEPIPQGPEGVRLLAVSPSGEVAVILESRPIGPFFRTGTLARIPLAGGTPRHILEDVQEADWTADGRTFAVVRYMGGKGSIEFPIGRKRFEVSGYIGYLRLSPRGNLAAYVEYPGIGFNTGSLGVVDLSGRRRTLVRNSYVTGLAWAPDGDEIWYGEALALRAVSLTGKSRVVDSLPEDVRLYDISRDGRVLLAHQSSRFGMTVFLPGEKREKDLSWHSWSVPMDLSRDGSTVLFTECGAPPGCAMGLRKVDGSAPLMLGEGFGMGLSRNGDWVLAQGSSKTEQLVLVPTGAGTTERLARGPIEKYGWGTWHPDGKRVLFVGNERGGPNRLYVQDRRGASPRAISTVSGEMIFRVSPDGGTVAALGPDRKIWLFPVEGTGLSPRPLPGAGREDLPIGWSGDGRHLYVQRNDPDVPARIDRVEITSGHSESWTTLFPSDPAGTTQISPVIVSPDGKSFVYGYQRYLSDLYLVEGLR
jgi:eukaryotic-like serine/threonine-protein kinase